MTDRHPKWQRVEPGTVIPAGRPYAIRYLGNMEIQWAEYVARHAFPAPARGHEWFVDSSWKPPLVLPTEPTWGIVLSKNADRKDGHTFDLGRWAVYGDDEWSPLERTNRSPFDTPCDVLSRQNIADFIPLTGEQIERIEAAR